MTSVTSLEPLSPIPAETVAFDIPPPLNKQKFLAVISLFNSLEQINRINAVFSAQRKAAGWMQRKICVLLWLSVVTYNVHSDLACLSSLADMNVGGNNVVCLRHQW